MSQLSNKYYSDRQEKMIASFLGWSVVSGSGARSTLPGDIRSEDWLGECKTHDSVGHKINFKKSVWKKIEDEASSKFKFPALFVDDGSQTKKHTWVMFKILPVGEYQLVKYPNTIKDNILFDSLSMLEHRKSVDSFSPVVYDLSDDVSLKFISTLEDFAYLFFQVR